MSIVKIIELSSESPESWEDATRQAVERASRPREGSHVTSEDHRTVGPVTKQLRGRDPGGDGTSVPYAAQHPLDLGQRVLGRRREQPGKSIPGHRESHVRA